MNLPDLSLTYSLIRKIADSVYVPDDLKALDEAAEEASSDLRTDVERFHELLDTLRAASIPGADTDLASALIHLRICAMNISSEFDNLADAIAHLFQRGAV